MKYIDADKLIAEINNRLMSVNLEELGNFGCHRVWAYNDVKDLITSIQQEQPEVDLEKEIARENEKWTCYEDICLCALYDARPFDGRDIERIARHFYELGRSKKEE